ncbi:MAG: hypothetical protein LBF82_01680 [Lactobacillales bacterium]|jgi:hypothetical protein|nr:hypothetical protein [Lactobacillales bacterium]
MKYLNKYNLSPKEEVFMIKKNIIELIYNAGQFEALNTTKLQTEEIIKYNQVNNVPVNEVLTIVNLKKGFALIEKFTQNDIFKFARSVNKLVAAEDALKPGEMRTGNVQVPTKTQLYIPSIPLLKEVEDYFLNLPLKISSSSATNAALEAFLYITKKQLFWDGNKCTALIATNKILFEANAGIFSIPEVMLVEFNKLLSNYYDGSEIEKEILKQFLYEKTIFGIDYK